MKRLILLGAAAAASVLALGAAQASVTVTVWGGYDNATASANPLPDNPLGKNGAQDPNPSILPVATFTWNGPINWVDNSPENTGPENNLYSQFFIGGSISGFSSPDGTYSGGSGETDFLASSMSEEGDSYWTYIRVDGTAGTGTVSGTISHDDGASVYSASCAAGLCYNSPAETTDIVQTFAMGPGAYHIDYIEGNGSPSDLSFSTIGGVPELSTWAMLLAGFGGLGLAGYRRGRKAAVID